MYLTQTFYKIIIKIDINFWERKGQIDHLLGHIADIWFCQVGVGVGVGLIQPRRSLYIVSSGGLYFL